MPRSARIGTIPSPVPHAKEQWHDQTGRAADHDMPWSFPILVAQVPEAGLHQALHTTAVQRERMAAAAGVNAMPQAEASFDVVPAAGGRFHVTGRVRARVEQTCS